LVAAAEGVAARLRWECGDICADVGADGGDAGGKYDFVDADAWGVEGGGFVYSDSDDGEWGPRYADVGRDAEWDGEYYGGDYLLDCEGTDGYAEALADERAVPLGISAANRWIPAEANRDAECGFLIQHCECARRILLAGAGLRPNVLDGHE
jgi:hypothetical protein